MNEWCINQHGRSGLTQACLDSPHTYDEVYQKVVAYIQKWVPEKGAGILAGSSVHADARWLRRGMPDVMRHLSYRIVDVSSIKVGPSFLCPVGSAGRAETQEVCKRWYPSVVKLQRNERKGEASHRYVPTPTPAPLLIAGAVLPRVERALTRSALDDIKGSIRELEFYRSHIFIPVEPPRAKTNSKPASPARVDLSVGGDEKVEEVVKQLRKTDI